MEFKVVKECLESLSNGVETGTPDEELLQLIEKITAACISETFVSKPGTIMALITKENRNLCDSVDALLSKEDTYPASISASLEFLGKLLAHYVGNADAVSVLSQTLTRIMSIATGAWTRCRSAKNRAAGVELLIAVVSFASDVKCSLELRQHLNNMVNDVQRNPKAVSVTVKQPLYKFFGLIAQYYPDLMEDHAEVLSKIFFSELAYETDPNAKSSKYGVVAGCLDGMDGFLHNFEPHFQIPGPGGFSSRLEFLFDRCGKVIHKHDMNRYAMVFSALNLLHRHMEKFRKFLLDSKRSGPVFQALYADFLFWANHRANREASKLGYNTLESFLKEMSLSILAALDENDNVASAKQAYAFFDGKLLESLKDTENTREYTLALRGYGYFMKVCRMLTSPENVESLITEMICKSEQMFSSRTVGESAEESLENLPSFVEALALMVHSADCQAPFAFLAVSERLCILLMDSFPRFTSAQQHFGCQALVKVFFVTNKLDASSEDSVGNIVYQGLIRSCSYPIPADTDDKAPQLLKKGVSYKDYIIMWRKLVNCNYNEDILLDFGAKEYEVRRMKVVIFDALMKAALRVIKSLNFDLVASDADEETASSALTPVNKKPSKEQDFQIFFSLEQLLTPVLKEAPPDAIAKWCPEFCREIIMLLEKHPLVAGLYRFLSNWWICAKESSRRPENSEDMDVDEEFDEPMVVDGAVGLGDPEDFTVRSFVNELIGKLPNFTDEVLVAALYVVLNAPAPALKSCFHLLESPLKLALQAGRSDLQLAEACVEALSRLCFVQFSIADMAPMFPGVLPLLDHYLQSQSLDVMERSKLATLKNSKRRMKTNLRSDETDLTKIRGLIMRFLGQLGGKCNSYVIGSDFVDNIKERAVAWDMENHLQFALPFADMVLTNFYLDDLVPRVCELSLNSPDRATKVAACELLHSITIFLIGTNANIPKERRKWSTMLGFIAKLFPRLLELACDVEPVATQMFCPLVNQIVHWYSRSALKAAREAEVILDCIVEGLVSEQNSLIRDFSAQCVAEYLEMAIRSAGKSSEVSPPIVSLLDRLMSLACHSNATKRFGAALAFNHCYKVFRENKPTAEMFTIALVVNFTKSLAMTRNDTTGFDATNVIKLCLDHLNRIVSKFAKELAKPSSKRRRVVALKEPTLSDLVDWLLLQGCRSEGDCRVKSLELFEKFAAALNGANGAAYYFDNLTIEKRIPWLMKCFMNGGVDPDVEQRSVLNQDLLNTSDVVAQCKVMEQLAAPLDCFTWAFQNVYLKPLHVAGSQEWEEFISVLEKLVTFIRKWSPGGGTPLSVLVKFRKIKSFVTVRITDFILSLLVTFKSDGAKLIPAVLTGEDYLDVLVRMVFEPDFLDLEANGVDQSGQLLRQMQRVLSSTIKFLGPKFINQLKESFGNFLTIENNDILKRLSEHKPIPRAFVEGFCLIHSLGLTSSYLDAKEMDEKQVFAQLLLLIQNDLKLKYDACGGRADLWSATDVSKEKLVFRVLLQFTTNFGDLISHLFLDPDMARLFHKLKGTLFRFMFADDKTLQKIFIDTVFPEKKPGDQMGQIEIGVRNRLLKDSLTFLTGSKLARKAHGSSFVLAVLQPYGMFLSTTKNSFDDTVRSVLDVFRLILALDPLVSVQIFQKPSQGADLVGYYIWILRTPSSNNPVVASTKNYALSLLPFFLSSNSKAEVEEAIESLSINDFPIKAAELINERRTQYLDAVNRLLDSLETSPNSSLFKICVDIVARDPEHPLVARFQRTFESLTANDHSEVVQTYFDHPFQIFLSTAMEDARIVMIDTILIPMLRAATVTALTEFFTRNMKHLVPNLESKRSCNSDYLLTMRCSYSLLEILFSSVPKNQLAEPASRLNIAFLEVRSAQKAVTGKEFLEYVMRATDAVIHENFDHKLDQEEARRTVHCAAYRTLVAALTVFQKDNPPDRVQKFYQKFLFEESSPKDGKTLWSALIDAQRVYSFEVELTQVPQRKVQWAAIHKEVAPTNTSGGQSSLSSGLFTATSFASAKASAASLIQSSSLADDVGRFDMSNGLDRKTSQLYFGNKSDQQPEAQTPAASVVLESDDLNKHECMATVVALIQHMVERNIATTDRPAPDWVIAWLNQLKAKNGILNVRLFLAKAMINTENSERPYFVNFAEDFYGPIIDLIPDMKDPNGLNYFVVDLIQMMLKWSLQTVLPEADHERAQNLFEYVIKHSRHENSQVQKNNLILLKVMSASWASFLVHPSGNLLSAMCTSDITKAKKNLLVLNIIAILAQNSLRMTERNVAEYQKILSKHITAGSKPIFTVAAFTTGIVIAELRRQNLDESVLLSEVENFFEMNGPLKNYDRFITVLHEISRSCPDLAEAFVGRILFGFKNLTGDSRKRSLEVLITANKSIERPYQQFQESLMLLLLANKDDATKSLALRFLGTISDRISPQELEDLFKNGKEFKDLFTVKDPLIRQQAYEFCMRLYDRCRADERHTSDALMGQIRGNLFAGLKDKDAVIRELLTNFWKDDKRLTATTFARLQSVFKTFAEPEIQSCFLPTACHLVLDLCRRSPNFTLPIFPQALSDCAFFQVDIQVSWKQRATLAPVTAHTFAPSSYSGTLGSLKNASSRQQLFTPTQVSTGTVSGSFSASQSSPYGSQFSQSLMISLAPRNFLGIGGGDNSQFSQQTGAPAQMEKDLASLRRRFQKADPMNNRKFFVRREMAKKKEREEILKEERERRGLQVGLTRVYRVGEDPDIQIPYSSLITPLQVLAEHDSYIASLLLTKLFGGIIDESRKGAQVDQVEAGLVNLSATLDPLMRNDQVSDVMFLRTLLNVISVDNTFRLVENVSADAIGVAALRSRQIHLGIATLEHSITFKTSEPASKKSKKKPELSRHWLELFRLFRAVGESDSIQGLKLDHIFDDPEKVEAAIHAEAHDDMKTAATTYRALCDAAEHDNVFDVLLDSHLQCLDKLGRWSDIERTTIPKVQIAGRSTVDMSGLWNSAENKEKLIYYSIRCKLKQALDFNEPAKRILKTFFDEALADPVRKDILEKGYGYELCLFDLCSGKYPDSVYHLKCATDRFLDDWSGTSKLNLYGRQILLPKIQLFEEITRFQNTLEKNAPSGNWASAEDLLIFLVDSDREASPNTEVNEWNDLILNRCFFARELSKKSGKEANSVMVESFVIREKLQFAQAASRQHYFDVVENLSDQTKRLATEIYPKSTLFSPDQPLNDRFILTFAASAVEESALCGDSPRAVESMKKLGRHFELLQSSLLAKGHEPAWSMKFMKARVLRSAACLLERKVVSIDDVPGDVHKSFGFSKWSVESLNTAVLDNLRSVCYDANAESTSEMFLELFRFCDEMLEKADIQEDELITTGSAALFDSIRLGNLEARDLFGRLLVWLGRYPAVVAVFQKHIASSIPSWMFLPWANQMLALLDKAEGIAIHDLLLTLATEYPQAVYYGFKISKAGYVFDEKNEFTGRNRIAYEKLSSKLDLPLADEFVRQLEQFYDPHSFATDLLKKADQLLREKKKDQLKKEFYEIYQRLLGEEVQSLNTKWTQFMAKFRMEILALFGREGKKIQNIVVSQFKKERDKLDKRIKEDKAERDGKEMDEDGEVPDEKMSDVNPWLADFSPFKYGSELEIPGQYNGRERVRPELHVKIASFGEEIKTMKSIRRPKKITIRGDDEKEYPFLVKGGEDLRLDQRIQQLFSLMNRVFEKDSECSKRRLSIQTYSVVPMTVHVGILQWVQNTIPLLDFLSKGNVKLNNAERALNDMKAVLALANKAKSKAEVDAKTLYSEACMKIPADQMRAKFLAIEKLFDPYILRDQIKKLTVSPEAFIIVRNMFAEAYGTLAIGQYILGIGDRHLQNFLISMDSGRILPIDFGHAFGSATQFLPIPELVPMRMTRQFTNMMAPASKQGKLQQTMIHALRALRKNQQILLATMDVFVQEPSIDWLQNAKKLTPTSSGQPDDLLWFPRDKLANAKRKLEGSNSAVVMCSELDRSIFSGALLQKLKESVMGDETNVRFTMGESGLSVENQVECLMDHSTDGNLLGRVFFGWSPWI